MHQTSKLHHLIRQLSLSLLLLLAGHHTAIAQEDGILGPWLGEAEHNGQRSTMAIEFVEHPDHGLIALLSFPELGAWEMAAVPVELESNRIAIGSSWELIREADGTLSGDLPGFFVPVYEIPVIFRRVEAFDKAPAKTPLAPIAEPVWSRDLGHPVWAGLGTEGDLLFVGDDSGRLSALDAATGDSRWTFETKAPIRSRPVVAGATLFVHSDDGNLYALDPAAGTERWRARISDVERIPMSSESSRNNNYASTVAAAEGAVYVGGFDGSVVALDPTSGEERWRFKAGDTVAGTPAIDDGRVFFGSFDGKIYAVDAMSGRELWQVDTGAAVVSSPLVHDGLVVIGSRSYDILALEAATGNRVWKHYYWFSWIESSVTNRGGVGYVGASDGQDLLALDLANGKVIWRFDTHGSAWPQPAVTEDAVFIGTLGFADYWADHHAAFYAVDRETGLPTWQFPQQRPGEADSWGFAASPAVSQGLVFAADLDGHVYAFREHRPDSVP